MILIGARPEGGRADPRGGRLPNRKGSSVLLKFSGPFLGQRVGATPDSASLRCLAIDTVLRLLAPHLSDGVVETQAPQGPLLLGIRASESSGSESDIQVVANSLRVEILS